MTTTVSMETTTEQASSTVFYEYEYDNMTSSDPSTEDYYTSDPNPTDPTNTSDPTESTGLNSTVLRVRRAVGQTTVKYWTTGPPAPSSTPGHGNTTYSGANSTEVTNNTGVANVTETTNGTESFNTTEVTTVASTTVLMTTEPTIPPRVILCQLNRDLCLSCPRPLVHYQGTCTFL